MKTLFINFSLFKLDDVASALLLCLSEFGGDVIPLEQDVKVSQALS